LTNVQHDGNVGRLEELEKTGEESSLWFRRAIGE
jgi:hypothetical protein